MEQVSAEAHLDIVINGAGLSGIAVAIECATHGHSVTVIEGASAITEVYYMFPELP